MTGGAQDRRQRVPEGEALATPTTPATSPVRAPSAVRAPTRAPRLAPTARSSASCRIRCAKTMRKVEVTTSAAATTAMETNMPTRMKSLPTCWAAAVASASRTSAPERIGWPATAAVTGWRTASVEVPGATRTSTRSTVVRRAQAITALSGAYAS